MIRLAHYMADERGGEYFALLGDEDTVEEFEEPGYSLDGVRRAEKEKKPAAYTICPICKDPITEPRARSFVFVQKVHFYHNDCYDVLTRRLELFWEKLTGPEKEFERWLRGECS